MRLIDLFAGCGGLTEGFHLEGYEPVFAVEWDAAAAATYAVNFGSHVVYQDIASIGRSDIPDADVVVGGPPCQGFSQLGTRDPDDPRNHLWLEYAKVVDWVRPRAFVLENVPRFLRSGQFDLLQELTHSGRLLEGYSLSAGVLDAADFGVPQRRKRAFLIGVRDGVASLPLPTHGDQLRQRPLATVRDAIGDIFDTYPEPGPSSLPDAVLPSGISGPFKAREIHLSRKPTPLSLERYDFVPEGGNRFDLPARLLPACWANKPTGTTDVMGRLWWDRPSVTIRTEFFKPEKGRYLHPHYNADDPRDRANRAITHWEAARLQSFPDSFQWCGEKLDIARQIGNAVPPSLAAAVARHIRDELLR